MNDHGDRLREVFETQERSAPDAAAVYARVQELSRTYRRRRLGGQVAGGAVLGAGLIAGVIHLPAVLPADPAASTPAVVVAAPPSASPSPPATQDEAWEAYFDAGYDYADAERLALLWKSKAPIGDIKAEAGRRLLAGQSLPFPATPGPDEGEETVDSQEEKALQMYFWAGYDWDDAVQFAKLWNLSDPGEAKVEAGRRLLARQELPIKPDAKSAKEGLDSKRVDAFFRAGYDYDDAVRLAKIWKKKDAWGAKVEGGRRLLAGQTLPFRP